MLARSTLLLLLWQRLSAIDVPLESKSIQPIVLLQNGDNSVQCCILSNTVCKLMYNPNAIRSFILTCQPTVRQPPTIIKQSLKDHVVDPRDNMVIECEAKGTPHPM